MRDAPPQKIRRASFQNPSNPRVPKASVQLSGANAHFFFGGKYFFSIFAITT